MNGNYEISKIAKIEVLPALKVFGPSAQHPDRPVVVVWTENGARFVAMVPLGAKYVNGKLKIFDPEKYHKSVSFAENGKIKSKFGAFVAKYKCCPCVGLEVATYVNGRGFFTISTEDRPTTFDSSESGHSDSSPSRKTWPPWGQ